MGRLLEDRYGMCRNVIAAAERNQLEIATSALSFAEVCKAPGIADQTEDKIAAFFEKDYILPVNLDRAVGERARALMRMGISKFKPADACHLATAALANVDEMHTFDDRLLVLTDKIDKQDGTKLKICGPDPGGERMPLLDEINAKSGPDGKK
jgi:predicted nucleic acid-binding protein